MYKLIAVALKVLIFGYGLFLWSCADLSHNNKEEPGKNNQAQGQNSINRSPSGSTNTVQPITSHENAKAPVSQPSSDNDNSNFIPPAPPPPPVTNNSNTQQPPDQTPQNNNSSSNNSPLLPKKVTPSPTNVKNAKPEDVVTALTKIEQSLTAPITVKGLGKSEDILTKNDLDTIVKKVDALKQELAQSNNELKKHKIQDKINNANKLVKTLEQYEKLADKKTQNEHNKNELKKKRTILFKLEKDNHELLKTFKATKGDVDALISAPKDPQETQKRNDAFTLAKNKEINLDHDQKVALATTKDKITVAELNELLISRPNEIQKEQDKTFENTKELKENMNEIKRLKTAIISGKVAAETDPHSTVGPKREDILEEIKNPNPLDRLKKTGKDNTK
jgi:hypothetical protein